MVKWVMWDNMVKQVMQTKGYVRWVIAYRGGWLYLHQPMI